MRLPSFSVQTIIGLTFVGLAAACARSPGSPTPTAAGPGPGPPSTPVAPTAPPTVIRLSQDNEADCVRIDNGSRAACSGNDLAAMWAVAAPDEAALRQTLAQAPADQLPQPAVDLEAIDLSAVMAAPGQGGFLLAVGVLGIGDWAPGTLCLFVNADNDEGTGYRDPAVTGIEYILCDTGPAPTLIVYEADGVTAARQTAPRGVRFLSAPDGTLVVVSSAGDLTLYGPIRVSVTAISRDNRGQDSSGSLLVESP